MKQTFRLLLLSGLLLALGACDSDNGSSDSSPKQASRDRADRIIIDDAYVLYDNEKLMEQYRKYNDMLLKNYDIDFRVITYSGKENIDLFANKAFAKLQARSRSHSGKALLLVINPFQDKVRLEVSQALEPVYTDAFVSYIERKGFVPYFRDYKIADGVYMATELVKDRAEEATLGKEFMPPMPSRSIGGGAKSKSYIGQADPNAKKGAEVDAATEDDPKAVMAKYLDVLKSHNKNPHLDIYTDATKAFFAKWTVTDINQDHEVRNISKCLDRQEVIYNPDMTRAVLAVRPYDRYRTCSPYFFKKEEGKWKLDIAAMAQVLRFNQSMQWHFDPQKRYRGEAIHYAFAFAGYTFGKNGFPFSVDKSDSSRWENARWKFSCNGYYHPGDRKEEMKCLVRDVMRGGPADVRLGLRPESKIYGFGEGEHRVENATYRQLLDYLASIPSGEVATIVLEHYFLNGKETYNTGAILDPHVVVRREVRRAVAP